MKRYTTILFLLPFFLLAQDDYSHKRDSLFAIARSKNQADTIRGNAYISLSELYYMQNIDSLNIVCQEGMKVVSLNFSKVPSALKWKLKYQYSELVNNDALGFYKMGDFEKSLQLWYQSLKLKEELKDSIGQTQLLNNIGNVQIDLEEMEKASKTFRSILPFQKSIGDSAGIARTYNTLGYIDRVGGNDSLALYWYRKALAIRLKINSQIGIAGSYTNIGFIFKKKGRFEEAKKHYLEAAKIYKKEGDTRGLLVIQNNLANCSFESKDYSEAIQFAQIGYDAAVRLKSLDDQMYLSEVLYKSHELKGNASEAFKYYKEYIATRDSIKRDENYKALINQELEYEYLKKEKSQELKRAKEKARADLKNQAKEEESFRFKLIAVIVSIGLVLVILLLFFIYKQLQVSKEQGVIIEQQNKEIEMKALRSQMNPHFLFNSLNSIKHFIIKNESTVAAGYLTKFAKLVRLVLENSKHNLIPLQEELDCLNNYLELEKLRFNGKFDYSITGNISAYSTQVPPLILQPFIENAIWHGILNKEDGLGQIDVHVKDLGSSVQIEITDNGIGRDKATEIASNSGLKKKSMGLTITHERLQLLNRVIGIESKIEIIDLKDENENPLGTQVIVNLPYE